MYTNVYIYTHSCNYYYMHTLPSREQMGVRNENDKEKETERHTDVA